MANRAARGNLPGVSRPIVLAVTLASVLVGGAEGGTRSETLPQLSDYSLLALERVVLRREARVPSGAVGAVAGTITLGRDARVTGTVAADTVRLSKSTRVGRLFCRLVIGGPLGGGVVGGPVVGGSPLPTCQTITQPLIDPTLLPLVQTAPGAIDLHVPAHSATAPIAAGSYADLVVGRGALLQLAGGSYTASAIRIRRRGRLVCTGECRIAVLGSVVLQREAQLGAQAGLSAADARIDISAGGPAPAFLARAGSVVAATIYAPAGDVVLGARGSYRGAYVGRSVTVGVAARVRERSAL